MPENIAQLQAQNAALSRLVEEQAAALKAREEELRAKVAELEAARQGLKTTTLLMEQLKARLDKLRRMKFGRSSEKVAQYELALEELEATEAEQAAPAGDAAAGPEPEKPRPKGRPKRSPPPAHLPREERVHEPDGGTCTCPACGGGLRPMGEDRTPQLEYVPARFIVVEHVRPKYSCRSCESIVQAPASLPIARGLLGPGLLAHILVSKFDDHLPLYRQSEILAREGIPLSRSTLASRASLRLR